jgi:ribonucleoside-diphosphate reductase alpha chain
MIDKLEQHIQANTSLIPILTNHALTVLEKRYLRRKESDGSCETPREMFIRVAANIAIADNIYDEDPFLTGVKFYDMMANMEFLPNSPTLRGAGRNTMMSACSVLPIEDSRESIFNTLRDAVTLSAHGVGVGYNFSKLRAEGSNIITTGGKASGPISFMKIYNLTLGEVISQGGVRSAASIAILRYDHPDIMEFIHCKMDGVSLRNFNISVGITEEFMKLAGEGKDFNLIDHTGLSVGTMNAGELLNKIAECSYATGDPGLIFMDRIDRDNPTPHIGKLEAVNPCSEQSLLPSEVCNLGSINLSRFATEGKVQWDSLKNVVKDAVHFLDNVIDVNCYPLEQVEVMAKGNRKIGLGVMGWADMLALLRVPYNSEQAIKLAGEVMGFVNNEAKAASVDIATRRGVFPNFTSSIYDTCKESDRVRNASWSCIAPGGTIGLIANCNGGIEPYFMLAYERGSVYDKNGKPTVTSIFKCDTLDAILDDEGIELSKEALDKIVETGSIANVKDIPKHIAKVFPTAHEVTPSWHVKMLSAFQSHVTSSISKTINLPHTATVKDVLGVYQQAYKSGNIKGITVFRDGCKDSQVMQLIGSDTNKTISPIITNGSRPKKLYGWTDEISTPVGTLFMTVNVIDDIPVEVLLTIGKAGSDITADAESIGRLVSLLLKYHVPVETIAKQLRGIGGSSSTGFGRAKVKSLPDAVAKVLEDNFVKKDTEEVEVTKSSKKTGNMCPECGVVLVEEEGCTKCPSCGFSKC